MRHNSEDRIVSWLAHTCVVARSDIGRGESLGNNRGPYLEQIREIAASGWRVDKPDHWCLTAVISWYLRGAHLAGIECPIRWPRTRKAQTGYRVISEFGSVTPHPVVGGVAVWKRGRQDLMRKWWQRGGHIELVESVEGYTRAGFGSTNWSRFTTIAGNVGPYPSVVHTREYRRGQLGRFLGFACPI